MNFKNVERMRDVLLQVQQEAPEMFMMDDWFCSIDNSGEVHAETAYTSGNITNLKDLDCGTAGCIAGWTVSEFFDELKPEDFELAGNSDIRIDIPATAARILGLYPHQAQYLFLAGWGQGRALEDIPVSAAITELEWMLESEGQWENEAQRYATENDQEGGYHP